MAAQKARAAARRQGQELRRQRDAARQRRDANPTPSMLRAFDIISDAAGIDAGVFGLKMWPAEESPDYDATKPPRPKMVYVQMGRGYLNRLARAGYVRVWESKYYLTEKGRAH